MRDAHRMLSRTNVRGANHWPTALESSPSGHLRCVHALVSSSLGTKRAIIAMHKALTIVAAAIFASLFGCATPLPVETLRSVALSAAQQRGAAEFECPAATGQIVNQETLPEPQGTGWAEYPHRAAYKVDVSGCGKRATYSLTCDDRQKSCALDPEARAVPRRLADTLQPGAVSAAQQRGAADLGCPTVTSQVTYQQTIEEPQGTGWYEPPHRAVYAIGVSGCGNSTTYLVSCDDRQKNCVVGTVQKKEAGRPQLADKLQTEAVRVAQQRGAADLGCPATTAEVLQQATLEEPQTTGWNEAPHRAAYSIAVAGCGNARPTRLPVTACRRAPAALALCRIDSPMIVRRGSMLRLFSSSRRPMAGERPTAEQHPCP